MPIGELAALATSLCWTATSTFFTRAGQRVGSAVVNRMRTLLASVVLLVLHGLFLGQPLPLDAERWRWAWLALSGVIGLALGDAFLFQAFVWIGPRLTMLLMSLSPLIATLVAWPVLGEALTPPQWLGLLLTVAGVAWVVGERTGGGAEAGHRRYGWGLLFGLLAATSQALGLITAKKGLGNDFPALSANVIRMVTATSVLWGITLLQGRAGATFARLRAAPDAWRFLLGGTAVGPVLGVSLSLFAVQHAAIGVASTLMALPPLFLLPVAHFAFRERVSPRTVAGTLVALAGVAVLFLA